jgi:succinoglycan biosynthesis transport protein ExoP
MAQTESSLHFSEYFRIIRNRLWVIFTIFALTLISGIYVTEELVVRMYTATAQIKIQSSLVHVMPGIAMADFDRPIDPTEFQTEYERMHSPQVLEPVIIGLGLDKIWAQRIFKMPPGSKVPMQSLMAYMNNTLAVSFKHGTNLVEVSTRSEVPKEAADIANAVVAQYKKIRDDEQAQNNSTGSDTLQNQIAQQEKVVDEKKAYREKLRDDLGKKNIVIDPNSLSSNSLSNTDNEELQQRQKDLLDAQKDAEQRQVLFDSTKGLSDTEFVATLEGMMRAPANLSSLQSDILQQVSTIKNLQQLGYGDQNERILAVQAQLAQERDQYATLIAGARSALKIDATMAQAGVGLLQAKVNEIMARNIKNQTEGILPYLDADRDYEKAQSLLDTMNIRLKQDQSTYHLLESPVQVFSPAETPDIPSYPDVTMCIGLCALAGLVCGVIVAFLIEYLDTSVKTMADAEHLLGLPVLAIIPNKGGPMPMTQQSARLPHAEGYRILRAKLNLKVQNGLGPCVTMLSGGPGEGKSTTIYNLAIVCAQAGQSVILVDCDLRRPTLHDLLDVSNENGVSNYLRGEGDALTYIQQTSLPKLHVLTAGDTPIADIGNLSGDKISALIGELKQRYDLVLIDSPPVLGISDGSIIAREVDYVILVIQHRRYPREISLRAKKAVEEVHGNCVGMVLNAVAVKSDDSYYYYSNYGNYYAKAGKRRRKKKLNGTAEPEVEAVRTVKSDNGEF